MSKCTATTKKGEACKNSVTSESLCHIHKFDKAPGVKYHVYNPYYKTYVDANGHENCGLDRKSLSRIDKKQENFEFVSSYCDVLPLKDIKYIVGPVAYTEFKYQDYNIGLFGESHSLMEVPKGLDAKSTLNFSSFLTSVVTQNPKKFDFFLEMGFKSRAYQEKELDPVNTMFNILSIDFKKCLSIVKDCPYKNLRAHYADYRSVSDIEENPGFKLYQNTMEYYKERMIHGTGDIGQYIDFSETQDLISNALKIYQETEEKVDKLIKTDRKIARQLDHNPLKQEILGYMDVLKDQRLKDFKEFAQRDRMFAMTETHGLDAMLIELSKFFLMVYASIMDIYTLARMFRTFGKGDDPKNIIVYAGSAHTQIYSDFLAYYIRARKTIEIDPSFGGYIEFSDENKRKSFLFRK